MTPQIVTRQVLAQRNIDRRIAELTAVTAPPPGIDARAFFQRRDAMLQELHDGKIPMLPFPERFDFRDHVREVSTPGIIAEIVSQGSFGDDFSERRMYELDAGRSEEPILYTPVYDQQIDSNFPELIPVSTMGPVGVVLMKFNEGGEVQFATVGKSDHAIRIEQFAAGLRYTQKLIMYNQTWMIGPVEREFGKATNAQHNHAHFAPILTHTYTAEKQTAASAVGSTLYEKVANTLDAAISASVSDADDPRRGPYVLLCSVSDLTKIERALGRVPQQGFDLQPSTMNQIRTVIAYDGWTGRMGKDAVNYPGVAAGKCYLIHVGHRQFDFQSKVKVPFRQQSQEGDLKRFIAEEIVFDTHYGLFAAPDRAVQEITLPTS